MLADDILRTIVLLTSASSRVKDDVFVTVVFKFKILGLTSNLLVTAFHTSPSPANSGYSGAEFSIDSST